MNRLMDGKRWTSGRDRKLMFMEGEGKLKWGIYMKENLRRREQEMSSY